MEVKVTIQCPELAAAISKLADAIASKTTPTAAPVAPVAPAPAAPQFETFAPVPAPTDQDAPPWTAPTPAAPAPVPAPAPTPAPVVDAAYRNKVATAAARLIDQNKMPEVLKALEECGAQAVTQLDANSMPLFVEKITALGAVI